MESIDLKSLSDNEILKLIPRNELFKLINVALWVVEGEEFGYKVCYHDAELIAFRRNNV